MTFQRKGAIFESLKAPFLISKELYLHSDPSLGGSFLLGGFRQNHDRLLIRCLQM